MVKMRCPLIKDRRQTPYKNVTTHEFPPSQDSTQRLGLTVQAIHRRIRMGIGSLQRLLPHIHIHPLSPQLTHCLHALPRLIALSHKPRYTRPPDFIMRHKKIPVPACALLFEIGRVDERFQSRDNVLFLEMCIGRVEVRHSLLPAGGVSWGG